MSKYKKIERSPETLADVQRYPIWAIDGSNGTAEWGIKKETCEYFGVRTGYSEVEQKILGYYFPVYKSKEIQGYVKVDPSKPKKQRFMMVGDVSVDCQLLGQVQAEENKGAKLFIVEGVKDLLITFQSMNDNKGNYKGMPNVVTFPLGIGDPSKGATNARQALAANVDFVQSYGAPEVSDKGNMMRGVVTCFDNDNPSNDDSIYNVGQEGVKDCALVLKDFWNVVLPVNDCWDLWKKEGSVKLFKTINWSGKPFQLGSVSNHLDNEEELFTPLKKGIILESFPETMRKLHGLREREFTIVLAPPKCGKTTLCKAINYELIRHNQPTLGVYLEEDLVKTRQSFIALHAGVHLPRFRENPKIIDEEKKKEALEILDRRSTMFYDDKVGKLRPDQVIPLFEWAAIRGVKYIILDHLSFVFSGDKAADERKGIDNLLTDIAAFVKKTGVHVIAVAHIKRDLNKPKPKNKDGSIKYPYWYEVEETDGRGSGAFEQVCWNMIAIDKQVMGDKSRGLTRTKVLYNREWDLTGVADTLTMNPSTGRLQVVEEQEEY